MTYKLALPILLISFVLNACTNQLEDDPIEALLAKMTLQEKVGQMTQVSLDVLSEGDIYALSEPHQLNDVKLDKAIVQYGVGSVLNVGISNGLGHAYTKEHWNQIVAIIQDKAVNGTRLGIPVMYGIDAIHGTNYTLGSTLFPQPLAQAATFDPALVEQGAQVCAYETRASGIAWNFSPVLDVARQPLWSRVFETYGEDVLLCKTMGTAAIRGYQGPDPSQPYSVGASMKHFVGYSMPFSGKDRTSVYLSDIQLREIFLPSFEAAIEQGALSVMINSGDINGVPVHTDHYLLTTVLRDELGFDGVAITDWEDITKLHQMHRVAKNEKEAIKLAINAGIDMSMVPNNLEFCDLLVELVEEDQVSMERINEAVRRILRMKQRLGLFAAPTWTDGQDYSLFGSDSFVDLSYRTAAESITLLKNDNDLLPLDTDRKILVTGPAGSSYTMINGAWSRTWLGQSSQWNDSSKMTIMQALEQVFPSSQWHMGCTLDSIISLPGNASLSASDVVIACMGEGPSTEKPGDIDQLDLEAAQIEYVKQLARSGKPIVLILVENRPRIVREIEPFCDAILMAYQPSENGSKAVADIVAGKVNPSGRLPITYPRYANSLITYDHRNTDRLDIGFSLNAFQPQWEFGHGLSYTNFNYGAIMLDRDSLFVDDTIHCSITVSNTGDFDGKETVLVYVQDQVASIAPPVKRLRAFSKQLIRKGDSAVYRFAIPVRDLAFVNKELKWITEPGEFTLIIGDQTRDLFIAEY